MRWANLRLKEFPVNRSKKLRQILHGIVVMSQTRVARCKYHRPVPAPNIVRLLHSIPPDACCPFSCFPFTDEAAFPYTADLPCPLRRETKVLSFLLGSRLQKVIHHLLTRYSP